MFKNVASQKWTVFAFQGEGGANPGNPVTGDAANITANLRLDGGAANAVDDVNPAELEDGYYVFDITQAETNADMILMAPASGTANVIVIGVPGVVYTTTAMRGTDDALKPTVAARTLDVTAAGLAGLDLDNTVGTWAAAQFATAFLTASKFAAGAIDAAAISADFTDEVMADWEDGNRLDLILDTINTNAARLTAARAAVLTDWVNDGRLDVLLDAIPTTAMRGTDGVDTSTMRGTDNASLAVVVGALADAAAAGDPTNADTLMQYIKQLLNVLIGTAGVVTFPAEAAPANAVSLAEVIRAIHTDVTGLNGAAMRGTDSAALAAVCTEARLVELAAANMPTDIAGVKAETELIVADTGELQADWVNGGRLDLILDIVAADTTTDIPALIAALNDISAGNVLTQVNAALDESIPELGVGVPTATPTLRTAQIFLYMGLRNKRDTTSSSDEIHNDAGTVIASAVLSDDTVVFISGEYS